MIFCGAELMYHRRSLVLWVSLVTMTITVSAWAVEPMPKHGKLNFDVVTLAKDLNEACAVVDVNKDGKPDVLAGSAWYEAPNWKKHPVRDIGVQNEEFLETNGDHAIDLNGDGYPDVMSATWFSNMVHWYENPGKDGLAADKKWTQHVALKADDCIEGALFEDLDGDGVPEMVLNLWEKQRQQLLVHISPGRDGKAPAFKLVQIGGPGYGHGMGIGDINGDKRPDIVVPHGWYEQPASKPFEQSWTFHKQFTYDHVSLPCLVVDVNSDGRNDVIIGQAHNYGLRWLEQQKDKDSNIAWKVHDIDKTGFSQAHCLVWADLDGDGQKELITGKRWRAHADSDPGAHDPVCLVRYIWNARSGEFERDVISYNEGIGSGMQICIQDLDSDKKPDIAVAGKSGTYILFNRGLAVAKGK